MIKMSKSITILSNLRLKYPLESKVIRSKELLLGSSLIDLKEKNKQMRKAKDQNQ